jgi:hypothetical protein
VIKEEHLVKLVTVTVTDIFVCNELVTHKLLAVELHDGVIRIGFVIEHSTLPDVCNPGYSIDLRVSDLQEWIGDGTDVDGFVEKLESKLIEAVQVKTERKN